MIQLKCRSIIARDVSLGHIDFLESCVENKTQLERIKQKKNDKSRIESLCGYLLSKDALQSFFLHENKRFQLDYLSSGKPIVLDTELNLEATYKLSISHDEGTVCVIICENQHSVGVDIMSISRAPISNETVSYFIAYFTNSEWRALNAVHDDEHFKQFLFSSLWILKEAFVKMTGSGLSSHIFTCIDFLSGNEALLTQLFRNRNPLQPISGFHVTSDVPAFNCLRYRFCLFWLNENTLVGVAIDSSGANEIEKEAWQIEHSEVQLDEFLSRKLQA
jgi:phosphopantetheine--protein transferase-like protein